ncbi:MAG: hypothetical protein HYW06_06010 [Gemmatimonadetes bacterium]|nr:hypothetical protein [Gemmatimonadota bacterium]MBI2402383.1 hypothetical protein [Gemmatimonadota bacterium]MBI2536510.1 hypothetical protein [Gemmatimonadota bacterium]
MFANPLVDVLGWLGAACVLTAYGLVSAGRVHGTSRLYQVPNAIGSVLLTVNTYFYHAYPSSFVNVLWLGIALYALRAGKRGKGNGKGLAS